MGKLNIPAAELDELKVLIPEHLHKWIDYLPEPEPDDAPTPNEERSGVVGRPDIPGSHIGLPIARAKPLAPKPRVSALPKLGGEPAPKATLNPKPGLNAKGPLPSSGPDLQKALLDLALSDDDGP